MSDGLCQCGCGLPAPIASQSNSRYGHVRGQPMRFRRGHRAKVDARPQTFVEEDRGYETPCLIWQGARNKGYGVRYSPERKGAISVHVDEWQKVNGPLPARHHLHHRCDQSACGRVDHLLLVSASAHHREHARLTDEDIAALRALPAWITTSDAAVLFGIDRGYASRLRRGLRR